MAERLNNYQIQVMQAKQRFLTYDQQELIQRCRLRWDEEYLYLRFIAQDYRILRKTGDMERFVSGRWVDGNSFNEVMTILDWLCDSRPDRYVTGRWINILTHGHYFHRDLQEDSGDSYAELFARMPDAFAAACEELGGKPDPSGDVSYCIELLDGLPVLVQLWYGDEEFPPRLRCLWDENATRYIRYETTWYTTPLLMERIKENMPKST